MNIADVLQRSVTVAAIGVTVYYSGYLAMRGGQIINKTAEKRKAKQGGAGVDETHTTGTK
eukprot:m.47718 g.47718  ORF g.47718 m.47718 type:complete len:60 (-) comp15232_c0_seq1:491-670(-)